MPDIVERTKRPVTVRTLEWTGNNPEQMRAFCGDAFDWRPEWTARIWNTQEGCAIDLKVGHHVVQGPLGEFYPLSPAALELTYEPPEPVDRDELLRRSEEDGAITRMLDAETGKGQQ